MSSEAFEAHEYTARSLREHLVPLSTAWADQVGKLESCPWYEFGLSDEFRQATKGLYTVPYPYKSPMWMRYIDQAKRGFTEEQVKVIWDSIKKERLEIVEHTCISDEAIGLVDNNYDYGAIIYRISGEIVPFQYSAIDGFEFSSIPADLPMQIYLQQYSSEADTLDYQRVMSEVRKLKGKFSLEYTIKYKNPDGDVFMRPGARMNAFPMVTAVYADDVNAMVSYMNTMFKAHGKCIVI